jgi:hypothetical protein
MRFFILSILLCYSISSFAKKKTILIVNSYHKGFEWVDDYTKAIHEALGSEFSIQSYDMNTKRIPKAQFKPAANRAIEIYSKLKPEIVVLADDHALSIAGPMFIKKGATIVFLGINNNPRNYFNAADLQKIYGVLEQPLILRSIVFLQEIFTDKLKTAVFQYDTCASSEYVVKGAFRNEEILVVQNVTTHLNQVRNYNEWKQGVIETKTNGFDVLFAGFYHCIVDEKLKHVNHDAIIKWSAKNSPVPVFAFWDFAVGKNKAIGGYVISGYEIGKEASHIIRDLLEGVPRIGKDKIVSLKEGSFLFSKSQLKRWNIILPKHIKLQSKFVD